MSKVGGVAGPAPQELLELASRLCGCRATWQPLLPAAAQPPPRAPSPAAPALPTATLPWPSSSFRLLLPQALARGNNGIPETLKIPTTANYPRERGRRRDRRAVSAAQGPRVRTHQPRRHDSEEGRSQATNSQRGKTAGLRTAVKKETNERAQAGERSWPNRRTCRLNKCGRRGWKRTDPGRIQPKSK